MHYRKLELTVCTRRNEVPTFLFVYCLNYSTAVSGVQGMVHRNDLELVFGAAINDGIEPFTSAGDSPG